MNPPANIQMYLVFLQSVLSIQWNQWKKILWNTNYFKWIKFVVYLKSWPGNDKMISECGHRPLLIMSCKISNIITSFTCMHFTKLICNWFQVNFQFSHISEADSIKSALPLYCIWTVPHVHNEPNAFNVWFAVCTQIALQSWNEVCKYHYTLIPMLDVWYICFNILFDFFGTLVLPVVIYTPAFGSWISKPGWIPCFTASSFATDDYLDS